MYVCVYVLIEYVMRILCMFGIFVCEIFSCACIERSSASILNNILSVSLCLYMCACVCVHVCVRVRDCTCERENERGQES